MDNLDAIAAIGGLDNDGEDFEFEDLGGKKHTIPNKPFSAAKAMFIFKEAGKVADLIGFKDHWQEVSKEVDEDAMRFNSQIAALGETPDRDSEEFKRYTAEWIKVKPAKRLWPTLFSRIGPEALTLLGELDENIYRALAIATISEEELEASFRKNDWPKKISARTNWLMFNVSFESLAIIMGATFRLVSIQNFFRILQTTAMGQPKEPEIPMEAESEAEVSEAAEKN